MRGHSYELWLGRIIGPIGFVGQIAAIVGMYQSVVALSVLAAGC